MQGRHGTDGTVKIIRPQVSTLTFTSGTLTDTDNAEINHSDGSFLAGSLEDKSTTLGDALSSITKCASLLLTPSVSDPASS